MRYIYNLIIIKSRVSAVMSDVSYHRERAKVNINKAVEFEQAENYQEAFNSYLQVLDCFKSMIKCKNPYLRS